MSRTVSHHVSKRCAERRISLADLVKLEVYDQVGLNDDDGGEIPANSHHGKSHHGSDTCQDFLG